MTDEAKEHVRFELPREVFGGADGFIYQATEKDAKHLKEYGIGAQVFDGPRSWEIVQVKPDLVAVGEHDRNSKGETVEVVGVTVRETVLPNPHLMQMRP